MCEDEDVPTFECDEEYECECVRVSNVLGEWEWVADESAWRCLGCGDRQ